MEEKKQTKQWKYSASGKLFRGFICMLTFCVFAVSAIVSMYIVYEYGEEPFTDPKESYIETTHYNNELNGVVHELLWNLECGYFSEETVEEMTILNAEESTIYTYYYEDLVEDFKNGYYDPFILYEGEDLEGLDGYVESKKEYFEEVNTLQRLKWYVKHQNKGYNYIYFDDDSFCELFTTLGIQNKDQCFSDEFSGDAYFIFMNNSLVGKSVEDLTFKMVNEMIHGDYAVYDPEEEVFYSTEDDFFDFQGGYLYSVEEIKALLSTNEYWDTSDVIFVLLHSYNFCNDYEYMISSVAEQEFSVDSAREALSHYTPSKGIYYYYVQDGFSVTNVTDDILMDSVDVLYTYEGSNSKDLPYWKDGIDFPESLSGELYEYDFANDGVLQVGIDSKVSNAYFPIIYRFQEYYILKQNCIYVVTLAIISFILLIMQAIGLIRTTGRTAKGEKEIHFNWYDKLITEIWVVISACIYIGCFAIVVFGVDNLYYYTYHPGRAFVISILAGILLFAFAFMEITLSFARRCKGRNLWNRSLLCKFYHFVKRCFGLEPPLVDKETGLPKEPSAIAKKLSAVVNKGKGYLQQIRGTYKLLIVFTIHVILSFICVIEVYDLQESFFILVFAVLQLIALVVVLYIVKDTNRLIDTIRQIREGNLDAKVTLNEKTSLYKELGDGINHIGDGLKMAVERSIKDERMKTELITNVSHDLKTPLTSIINYVSLLKAEKMPNTEAEHYIEVLETKSQRLKQLTEDLVEAAKATSGSIELEMMPIAFNELMKQAVGEFEDKYAEKNLTIVMDVLTEPAVVLADGRRLYRILENVLENAYKYALEGTRVYGDLCREDGKVTFTLKNVSAAALNISPDELMERFTRGDESRTTEGSGLGLSIAKDLTRLQGGEFEIILDGDLFKVQITFPEYEDKLEDQFMHL